MKKHIIKLATLLLFTSVAVSSCEVQYQERRMHRHDRDRYDRRYDHDDRYHHHYDDDNNHQY